MNEGILERLVVITKCRLISLVRADCVQTNRLIYILVGCALYEHLLEAVHGILIHRYSCIRIIRTYNLPMEVIEESCSTHLMRVH